MLHTATANSVTFTKLWTVGRELCNNKKYGVKHGMLYREPLLSFRFFDLGKTAAKLPCVYRNKTDCLTSVKNLNRSRCCGLAWVKGATHYVGARISTGEEHFGCISLSIVRYRIGNIRCYYAPRRRGH